MVQGRQRWLLWVAMSVLLLVALECARLALASAIASQVYLGMRQPGAEQHERAQQLAGALHNAALLNQRHPDYQDVELMLQRRAQSAPPSAEQLQRYRQLVQQRPAWPYVWLNLLAAKASVSQFDEEYHRAWQQLLLLSPWVRNVNGQLLQLGLRDWNTIAPSTQALVLQAVEKGLVLQPALVKQLAQQYQRTELLCGELEAKQRALLSCGDEVLLTGFIPSNEVSDG